MAAFGLPGGVEMLCLVPGLLLGAFGLWMLVDAIMRTDDEYPNPSPNSKLIWILVLILANGIGSVIYFFLVFRTVRRGAGGPTS